MTRVLVFQHLAVEHPGVLRDFLHADRIPWDTVELDEGEPIPDDLGRWDALIVMGGPMDTWQEDAHPWLVEEKRAIRRWLETMGRPYLGICLGHQLLADAMGGEVGSMAEPEVGICRARLTEAGLSDPLIGAFGADFACLQWHGAEVKRVPDGAAVLAVNDGGCIQALRVGDAAWGIQFHVEITADTVGEWSCVPEYAAALRQAMGANAPQLFDAAVVSAMPDFNAAAKRLYDRFMAAVRPACPPQNSPSSSSMASGSSFAAAIHSVISGQDRM